MHCFTLTEENHIAHLVLSRPEALNTMHPTFWRELDEARTGIHRSGTARVLVISSAGKPGSFRRCLRWWGFQRRGGDCGGSVAL